jgi:anti-sigma factor RsiW
MSCLLEFDQRAELIVGYGARTLDPDTAAAFKRHIDSCNECRSAAALQKAVWAALDEWHDTPISPDFDRRVFQRIATTDRCGGWLLRAVLGLA